MEINRCCKAIVIFNVYTRAPQSPHISMQYITFICTVHLWSIQLVINPDNFMLIIPHSQWLKMSNFTRAQWGDFKLFTRHAFIYIAYHLPLLASLQHLQQLSLLLLLNLYHLHNCQKQKWIFFSSFTIDENQKICRDTHLYESFWRRKKTFFLEFFRLKSFSHKTKSSVSSQSAG